MQKHNEIKITKEDLITILGDEWEIFQEKIIGNCFCGNCDNNYDSRIVDYDIFLNDLDDVVLQGKCAKCGNPIARYAETGEVERHKVAIVKLRERLEKN